MDLADFKTRYPEFVNVSDSQQQAFLDDAANEMDVDTWGDSYDAAHGLLAAHMLSSSPFLNTAKLQKKDGKTTYYAQYRLMLRRLGTTPVTT